MTRKKITFIDNARDVLLRAWSMRLGALSVIFSILEITGMGLEAAEVALPFLTNVLPPKTFAILSAIAAGGAMIARLCRQRNLP